MEEYEKITLLRSDLRPKASRPWLRPTIFYGKELYSGSSSHSDRPERWTELKIFQNKNGGYFAGIAHKSNWDSERDKYLAFKASNIGDVLKVIREHVPIFEPEVKQALGVQSAQ